MLGPDVLVAPVLEPGQTTQRLYLPRGAWVHLWTGEQFDVNGPGQWLTIGAALGAPPVFWKADSSEMRNFVALLNSHGELASSDG